MLIKSLVDTLGGILEAVHEEGKIKITLILVRAQLQAVHFLVIY